jgi:hypothetical protein
VTDEVVAEAEADAVPVSFREQVAAALGSGEPDTAARVVDDAVATLHQTLIDQLETTVQGYREYLDRVLR